MNTMIAVPFFSEDLVIKPNTIASLTTRLAQSSNDATVARLSWVLEEPISILELQKAAGYQCVNVYRGIGNDNHLEIRLTNPGSGHGICVSGPEAHQSTQKSEQKEPSLEEQTHDLHVRQACHQ